MKNIISLLLIASLIFTLLCGCGDKKGGNTKTNDGKIIVSTAEEFWQISKNPDKDYALGNNIDLGGKEWTPIKDFSGTLSGVWGGSHNYTVSNFTVASKKGDTAVGFARKISGSVSDIILKDITLTLPDGFEGSAGILAGNIKGDTTDVRIENAKIDGNCKKAAVGLIAGASGSDFSECYTAGSIKLSASGDTKLGGIVGSAKNVFDSECRTEITVDTTAKMNLGGIAGTLNSLSNVRFGGKINADIKDGGDALVSQFTGDTEALATDCYANGREFNISGAGKIKKGTFNADDNEDLAVDCVVRELSNLEEKVIPEKEYALRKEVVAAMLDQCTIPWMPTKDMHYTDKCLDSSGKCRHIQDYYKGVWYFGLPYTHQCGSVEKMRAYLTKDGKVKSTVNPNNFGGIFGNDCADAVYWALQTVSASPTYILTDGMICENGMIAVGTYNVELDEMRRKSTKATCAAITEQEMYENYALLCLGDAVVKGPGGHTRLVAENAYVYRNADGTINGDKSYIVTHEQMGPLKDRLQELHSTCRAYGKNTFTKLFSDTYVPVTVPEYKTGEKSPLETKAVLGGDTVTALKRGIVSSNYRIRYVSVTVKDGEKTVAEKTVYPPSPKHTVTYNLGGIVDQSFLDKLEDNKEYEVTIYINGFEEENIVKQYKAKK